MEVEDLQRDRAKRFEKSPGDVAEEVAQRFRIVVEGDKNQPGQSLAAHRNKAKGRLVELRGFVAFRLRYAAQFAAQPVGPVVIEAGEHAGIAGILPHHFGGPVAADIMEAANDAVGAAHQEHGLARDLDAAEIARLVDFALVTGKLPYLGENILLLFLEDALVGEDAVVQVVRVRKLWPVVPIQRLDHCCSPWERNRRGPKIRGARTSSRSY